jgi:hypothetical protein
MERLARVDLAAHDAGFHTVMLSYAYGPFGIMAAKHLLPVAPPAVRSLFELARKSYQALHFPHDKCGLLSDSDTPLSPTQVHAQTPSKSGHHPGSLRNRRITSCSH